MNEKLIETQYDVTRKSKIKKFYQDNKILIYSFLFLVFVTIGSIIFYFENEEKKKIAVANDYIKAKIYLENENRDKATNLLQQIINKEKGIYSALSLFLILDENLLENNENLSNLFDEVLKNNDFEKEMKNLIIFKKLLFKSNFSNELDLIEISKPIINSDSLWRPHALLLMGDFFNSRNEHTKAKDFYMQVLTIKDLHRELYDHAKLQLSLISNE